MSDFPELVLANDNDVLVALERVLYARVRGLLGHTRAVEHPLVGAHGHGQFLHVLGLQRAAVDHLLELEHSRGDGGGALGGIPTLLVVTVGVEVAHIGHDGVTVGHVCCVVPPLGEPVTHVGLLSPRDQALLQCLAGPAGCNEVVDSLCRGLVLGLGE